MIEKHFAFSDSVSLGLARFESTLSNKGLIFVQFDTVLLNMPRFDSALPNFRVGLGG